MIDLLRLMASKWMIETTYWLALANGIQRMTGINDLLATANVILSGWPEQMID